MARRSGTGTSNGRLPAWTTCGKDDDDRLRGRCSPRGPHTSDRRNDYACDSAPAFLAGQARPSRRQRARRGRSHRRARQRRDHAPAASEDLGVVTVDYYHNDGNGITPDGTQVVTLLGDGQCVQLDPPAGATYYQIDGTLSEEQEAVYPTGNCTGTIKNFAGPGEDSYQDMLASDPSFSATYRS
jgi:hypothetical protein